MMDTKIYDAIVIVTPADFKRVECNNQRIVEYLPVREVLFVGSEELKELVGQLFGSFLFFTGHFHSSYFLSSG